MEKNIKKKNIIDSITPDEALLVLRILIKEDKNIALKAEKIIREELKNVSIEDVAESVFDDLDSLEIKELWNSSGGTEYGYVEPVERADEMIEETLEPYFAELEK